MSPLKSRPGALGVVVVVAVDLCRSVALPRSGDEILGLRDERIVCKLGNRALRVGGVLWGKKGKSVCFSLA